MVMSWQFFSCANTGGSLSGGPKDEIPPVLDTTKSTLNYSVHFDQKKIELVFDEFITARSLLTKTLISPPLIFIPKLQAQGKKLTVEIAEEEVLKENATYIFNFGDAIADFREGNKLENFRFVFSTGAVIDSLSLKGRVYNAFDQKPVPDVYIMLYTDTRDSVVYLDKPFYFAITDKEGKFTFQNLRSDTFKLFALKDANLNYIYDQANELIGYLDSLIFLQDTTSGEIVLEMFTEGSTLRFLKVVSAKNGKLKLLFNEPIVEEVTYKFQDTIGIFDSELSKDTLIVWFTEEFDTTQLYIFNDTFKITPTFTESFLKDTIFPVQKARGNIQTLSPVDSAKLLFLTPLNYIDAKLISVLDTNGTEIEASWRIDKKSIKGKGSWSIGQSWKVTIMPGAITDIFGRINDTIRLELNVNSREKYGDILLNVWELNPFYTYQVNLLKQREIINTRLIQGQDSTKIRYEILPPGEYSLEILEDRNNNGRWDGGSYRQRTKSEIRHNVTLEKLRENWELAAEVKWKELSESNN
jgi:hypothetical protein